MSTPTLPIATPQTALAQLRIAQLAATLSTHRAFSWLHLHQPQLRLWLLEFLAIPAPPFAEQARAAWFQQRFEQLGLLNVHIDEAGNVLGELAGELPGPFLLLSAHLDTVFPAGTDVTPQEDGARILCPGACDNGAGLSGLLGLIAAMRAGGVVPGHPILFAANTGEEGEGNLRGMRHLFTGGSYRGRIAAALALEGSGTSTAVTEGLGSRRFRVTISGPGGHSWSDSGVPNPILLLAQALVALSALPVLASQHGPRSTLSPGQISGGTGVNSIPAEASVALDLRSTDPAALELLTLEVHRAFEFVTGQANRESGSAEPVRLLIELIGDRPAAALADDSALLYTVRAVDRHLGLRTELRMGSTDSNLPLSLGIQAAALSAGGTGAGIHTLAEWYDPTGRETALRRILLVALDLASALEG